jgi:transposase InsO family protein
VAVILDAWSRRVVGYAPGRSIDARLTVAALKAAIAARQPLPGCVRHSDRGPQYAAEIYCEVLDVAGLVGSMGRRGDPILKLYPAAAASLPRARPIASRFHRRSPHDRALSQSFKRRRRLGSTARNGNPIDAQVETAEAVCNAHLFRFIQQLAG